MFLLLPSLLPGSPLGALFLSMAAMADAPPSTARGDDLPLWLHWGLIAAGPAVLALLWWKDVIRPGSFSRNPGRDVSAVPAMGWLAGAFALYAASQVIGGLVITLPPSILGEAETIRRTATAAALTYAAAIAIGFGLLHLIRDGKAAPDRSLRAANLPVAGLSTLLAAPVVYGAMALTVWVYTVSKGTPPEEIAHTTLKQIVAHKGEPWSWLLIACVVVGAPLVEELIYRVFLQGALVRAMGSGWPAIGLTAALFALAHYAAAPWYALPPLFVVGLCLGVAYQRTGNLAVPVVMHGAFNAANVGVAVLG